jgi:DpnII restriction endonuclease
MSEPLKSSIAAHLKTLRESVTQNLTWPSPETEFARIVLSSFGVTGKYELLTSPQDLSGVVNRLQEAPILAAIGYRVTDAGAQTQELWAKSVERLTTRETFPNDRASFFYRPIELLGIARGIAGCQPVSAAVKSWFQAILKTGEHKLGAGDYWSFQLASYSAFLHNVQWRVGRFQELSIEEIALFLWLSRIAAGFAARLGQPYGLEDVGTVFLQRCLLEGVPSRDVAREATVYGALHCAAEEALLTHIIGIQSRATGGDACEIIRGICQRFHLMAQQLKNRRSGQTPLLLQDEYDVQYLMHGILKLHFDDVRPEEWCPSYAGRASRVDFLLKSEQVVIETKMTRKGLDDRKLGEELTLDKAKYRTNKNCRTLVCFVYDPEGYCKNPTALERDLAESGSNFNVLVVVAPKGS